MGDHSLRYTSKPLVWDVRWKMIQAGNGSCVFKHQPNKMQDEHINEFLASSLNLRLWTLHHGWPTGHDHAYTQTELDFLESDGKPGSNQEMMIEKRDWSYIRSIHRQEVDHTMLFCPRQKKHKMLALGIFGQHTSLHCRQVSHSFLENVEQQRNAFMHTRRYKLSFGGTETAVGSFSERRDNAN